MRLALAVVLTVAVSAPSRADACGFRVDALEPPAALDACLDDISAIGWTHREVIPLFRSFTDDLDPAGSLGTCRAIRAYLQHITRGDDNLSRRKLRYSMKPWANPSVADQDSARGILACKLRMPVVAQKYANRLKGQRRKMVVQFCAGEKVPIRYRADP